MLAPNGAVANWNSKEAIATLLTPRERQIAVLVSGGMSNKEIAQQIAVSAGTVKIHLSNIFQKLKCEQSTGADRIRALIFRPATRNQPQIRQQGDQLREKFCCRTACNVRIFELA